MGPDKLEEWLLERAQWNLAEDGDAVEVVDGNGSAAYRHVTCHDR